MAEFSVIGKPLPQLNLQAKVTGDVRYVADLKLPRTLSAAVLRRPYSHTRLSAVSAERSRALPGVRAVITGANVPDLKRGFGHKENYILAKDRVRSIGEEVVAVAVEDEHIAQQAIEIIDVEYEELPAVFDPIGGAPATDRRRCYSGHQKNRPSGRLCCRRKAEAVPHFMDSGKSPLVALPGPYSASIAAHERAVLFRKARIVVKNPAWRADLGAPHFGAPDL